MSPKNTNPPTRSTRPRVTVVTPCLNPGSRLVRCLDSIAVQTYPEIEHLVVDGGSTDGTVELLRERGASFISEPDDGQSQAINKGLALATGTYVGWLNADDLLPAGSVERAVEAFERDPAVGWVYGNCEVRRSDGHRWIERPAARLTGKTLDLGNRVVSPGTLIARWALDRVGSIDEDLHLVMDFDLWLRLIDARIPASYVRETLAVFELHEASKSWSVDVSDFYREEALVLLKHGRRRAAAVGLGRAAAAAVWIRDDRVNARELPASIQRFEADALTIGLSAERRFIASAAYAEAARLEIQATWKGVRHLARLDPWRFGLTRRLIGGAARRSSSRLTRRLLARIGVVQSDFSSLG